jgi:hypothetical protein
MMFMVHPTLLAKDMMDVVTATEKVIAVAAKSSREK